MTEIGKHYRDRVSGVTGKAIAQAHDPIGTMTASGEEIGLDLTQLDLHEVNDQNAHLNKRFYQNHRLTEVGADGKGLAPQPKEAEAG